MGEERIPATNELQTILAKLGLPNIGAEAISVFTADEDGAEYAVWLINTKREKYVLKRAKAFELETYRCFFGDKKPYAPRFFGSCEFGGEDYFLMEYHL